jgi:hypothetical protein
LFICSFGVIILLLDIDPLKLAVAAQELKKPLPLVPLLVTPDCDTIIKSIKDVAASEDST